MPPVLIAVLLFKFLLPLLFFWFPFPASWANFILDTTDGDVLMHFGLDYTTYQTWDKLADYVTYICMFLVGRRWKIGKTITLLFLLRTVGQIVFFITRWDMVFFFLPNFLEPLFMVYSFIVFKQKDDDKGFLWYRKHIVPLWIGIIAYKMWNEWNIHVARIDLSQFFFGFNN